MADKDQQSDPSATPEVDMDRIKAMMGPLPFESSLPLGVKPEKNKKKAAKARESAGAGTLAAAAEEANATLKALSSDMGQASITKIDDEPSGEDAMSQALLDDLASDALTPEAGEAEELADDPVTTKAVDDIVSHEGDTMLEVEDNKIEAAGASKTLPKESLRDKLKDIWAKRYVRWGTLAFVGIGLLAAGVVPTSRYFVLNTAGVRSSMTVNIIDSSTLQPLKNVNVEVAGVSSQTDSKGAAKLEKLKLGPATMSVSKRAFTTSSQKITVGWGSNPQGQLRLVASGEKYTFVVTNFLSGKPIEKAEAMSGEGSAVSDKDGRLVLVLDTSNKSDDQEIEVKISSDNYRSETVKITANNKETSSVKMVSSRKNAFVSKRSGKYDIYTIDVDGKNEQKIVTGTGIEREDLALAPQQNSDIAAYVATRENVRNSDGYLQSTLYMLDIKSGNLTKVDQSEQIQLVGWSSDQRLAYIKKAAGASAANPKRERLMSISAKDPSTSKELASANYFNDVLMAGDKVLYAPSNSFQDNPKPGLFMAAVDGSNTITVINKEVFNIFRTNYETVVYDDSGSFFSYKIGATPSSVTATTNPGNINRLYIDNIATARSLWIDNRDGKGVVLNYDKTAKKDTIVASQSGIKLPARWLDDSTIVYRVNDGKETADYVVSTNGGTARKIQDVTDASGVGRWFYY